MFALLLLFGAKLVKCEEEDEDDFWDSLSGEEVVVEVPKEGRLYDKARFNLPVKRRLRLYKGVAKAVESLAGKTRIEFIYEAKVPVLSFLDSDDVTVETIDIAKMSQDEVIALLNVRGFADLNDGTETPSPDATSSEVNETKPETEPQPQTQTQEEPKEL